MNYVQTTDTKLFTNMIVIVVNVLVSILRIISRRKWHHSLTVLQSGVSSHCWSIVADGKIHGYIWFSHCCASRFISPTEVHSWSNRYNLFAALSPWANDKLQRIAAIVRKWRRVHVSISDRNMSLKNHSCRNHLIQLGY